MPALRCVERRHADAWVYGFEFLAQNLVPETAHAFRRAAAHGRIRPAQRDAGKRSDLATAVAMATKSLVCFCVHVFLAFLRWFGTDAAVGFESPRDGGAMAFIGFAHVNRRPSPPI